MRQLISVRGGQVLLCWGLQIADSPVSTRQTDEIPAGWGRLVGEGVISWGWEEVPSFCDEIKMEHVHCLTFEEAHTSEVGPCKCCP